MQKSKIIPSRIRLMEAETLRLQQTIDPKHRFTLREKHYFCALTQSVLDLVRPEQITDLTPAADEKKKNLLRQTLSSEIAVPCVILMNGYLYFARLDIHPLELAPSALILFERHSYGS